MKARCYMEYCCNAATNQVVTVDRSYAGGMTPIPWGWCGQHYTPRHAAL